MPTSSGTLLAEGVNREIGAPPQRLLETHAAQQRTEEPKHRKQPVREKSTKPPAIVSRTKASSIHTYAPTEYWPTASAKPTAAARERVRGTAEHALEQHRVPAAAPPWPGWLREVS